MALLFAWHQFASLSTSGVTPYIYFAVNRSFEHVLSIGTKGSSEMHKRARRSTTTLIPLQLILTSHQPNVYPQLTQLTNMQFTITRLASVVVAVATLVKADSFANFFDG
jgi:ABC-type uncharacterized transport system permease subunit